MNTSVLSEHTRIVVAGNNLGRLILIALIAVVGILAIYHQTTWSMVSVWYRSETYAHGFLILPFTIYMIWNKRHYLATLQYQPNLWALLVFFVLGLGWVVAALASVQVLAQYILVAMVPAAVCAILGHHFFMAAAFPLAYLFFAVPFGEVLIPPLIDFTANFTVSALRLSGIPVYREGTFFSIPSGNWSVVEACSGLRYLIASMTLGTFYAYLTYHSLKRRFIFIVLSIIIPIIANGIRAYLIVMTGHLSDMRLATGADHLVYGWFFFGIVMLLLFWIGSLWREDNESSVVKINPCPKNRIAIHDGILFKKTILMAGTVLFIAFIWPSYVVYLEKKAEHDRDPKIEIPITSSTWSVHTHPVSDWEPVYVGTPARFQQSYQYADHLISLYITSYYNQQQGNELINAGNFLVQENGADWKNMSETKHSITLGSRKIVVTQNQLYSNSVKLLVWRWYWLGDDETTNRYLAKAMLAKNKLFGNGDAAAEIMVASPYEYTPDEAVPVLQAFLDDMLPVIEAALHNVNND